MAPLLLGGEGVGGCCRTVSRATARETAVKLVRLALAGFSARVAEDLSSQRSAFKLLKDAGKSAAAKKELAKEAAAEALVAARGRRVAVLQRFSGACAARSAARWQRGPALAAAAAGTAFRSGSCSRSVTSW